MNVMFVKLVTGDEFIAEALPSKEPNHVNIKNPSVVVPSDNGFRFMPWCMFSESREFVLDINHAVVYCPALTEMATIYAERFGGIITPPEPKIQLLNN